MDKVIISGVVEGKFQSNSTCIGQIKHLIIMIFWIPYKSVNTQLHGNGITMATDPSDYHLGVKNQERVQFNNLMFVSVAVYYHH